MARAFTTLDVFTNRAFEGNPLAVVTDAQGLSDRDMQAVAREFNLSETVFVLPPDDPAHAARLRIFTPLSELPFAGHPTVGTAVLLANREGMEKGAMVLETQAGAVEVDVDRIEAGGGLAGFRAPVIPSARPTPLDGEVLAAMLGLESADIGCGAYVPAIAAGPLEFTFVPVADRQRLASAVLSEPRWREALAGEAGSALYLFTDNTQSSRANFASRMFAPGLGVAEDPATGSAAVALAGYLMQQVRLADGDHHFVIEQGAEMGRPSTLYLDCNISDGQLTDIELSGYAVSVTRGQLVL